MLRKIIALWKGERMMKDVVTAFGEMLEDAEYVFTHAWGTLVGQMVAEQERQPLYDKDIAVNKLERKIRRMLAEHLAINPGQDMSGCLTMMSLIKDAERIGDYSKNIFELGLIYKADIKQMKYAPRLIAIQQSVSPYFPQLKKAFLESDEDIAKQILNGYTAVKDDCTSILHELFSDELSTREAVVTALLSRYLKRINSHISNIASGIVYPLDKIDFVQERGGLLE